MKKSCVFLFCMGVLGLALAVNKPNPPVNAAPLVASSRLSQVSGDKLFVSEFLGHVMYIASATQKDEDVVITINTPGYSFKPHKGFKGGQSIRVRISPNTYRPLIVTGPIGDYSYTVKRVN